MQDALATAMLARFPELKSVSKAALGDSVVAAVVAFARESLAHPSELQRTTFGALKRPAMRRVAAETFYGTRWLYKLGLLSLVTDVERAAHVRAQITDYGAVCEAVLLDAADFGCRQSRLAGQRWRYNRLGWDYAANGPKANAQEAAWVVSPNKLFNLRKQIDFRWLIAVAREEGIVPIPLAATLDWLREMRNRVHLAERIAMGKADYINTSRTAFRTVLETTECVATWLAGSQ